MLIHLHYAGHVVYLLVREAFLPWYILIVWKFHICFLRDILAVQLFEFLKEETVEVIASSHSVISGLILGRLKSLELCLDECCLLIALLWSRLLPVIDRECALGRRGEDACLLLDGGHRVINLPMSEAIRTRPDIQHVGRVWTEDVVYWDSVINFCLWDVRALASRWLFQLFHNGYHFEIYEFMILLVRVIKTK